MPLRHALMRAYTIFFRRHDAADAALPLAMHDCYVSIFSRADITLRYAIFIMRYAMRCCYC